MCTKPRLQLFRNHQWIVSFCNKLFQLLFRVRKSQLKLVLVVRSKLQIANEHNAAFWVPRDSELKNSANVYFSRPAPGRQWAPYNEFGFVSCIVADYDGFFWNATLVILCHNHFGWLLLNDDAICAPCPWEGRRRTLRAQFFPSFNWNIHNIANHLLRRRLKGH